MRRKIKLRQIVLALIVILLIGFLADIFFGDLHLISHSKNTYLMLAGLFLLGLLYLMGEGFYEWWGSKDDVSQPLLKRVVHFILLLCGFGIGALLLWVIYKAFTQT
jgi:hypothetical protein